ncbi:MAG: BolA/IbaG family iron-sulfur metabolism protein [Proteobacteria bacterium]|nr:BolA/IbaG family iron-sulfur metabolism protein [Pseudomonadota bacterium]
MKVKNAITTKLSRDFLPFKLEIINESHQHSVPKGSETHFKVIVVSRIFHGVSLVQRHRKIYESLKEELATGVHALSIHAFTPEEFEKTQAESLESPPCLGGNKS